MSKTLKPEAVIFDLYSTLIDIHTDDDGDETWHNLARFLCYEGLPAAPAPLRKAYFEEMRAMKQRSREEHPEIDCLEIFRKLLNDLGFTGPEHFCLSVTRLYRALAVRHLALFPDTMPTLQTLQGSFKLGLISDAQRVFLEPEMQNLHLIPFFDVRVVSWDYGFRKPDPRLFQVALTVLDVTPAAAVYVGDHSYRDVCGAHAAGMPAVWLNRSGEPSRDKRRCEPDKTVRNLNELVRWLCH